ncbi:MAG: response regulator [Flavobacteriales bacterium]|nr:response regulator [Flavobacteriales bacterium]
MEIQKEMLGTISGIDISTFNSAESCLEAIHQQPDLIILDYYLDSINPKNMNGHAALKKFREASSKSKILFISSKINEGLLEEYQKYRAVDFVLKDQHGGEAIRQRVESRLM